MEPAYAMKQRQVPVDLHQEGEGVNKHSLNRVKKGLNEYIMKNYLSLFKCSQMVVTKADILGHAKLQQKARSDLLLSTDPLKLPTDLIIDCIDELVDKKFLQTIETGSDRQFNTVFKINDLKESLSEFIRGKLHAANTPVNFEQINKWVKTKHGGFLTKEFVFSVIDEMFQKGFITETQHLTY